MSVTPLICGVDTLVLNVLPLGTDDLVQRRELSHELQEQLETYKLLAQEDDEPVPTHWMFEGRNLFMRSKGGSHFKWILEHPAFSLAVSRGVKVLMLGQVRFSSEFLWSCSERCTGRDGVRFLLQSLADAIVRVHAFLSDTFYASEGNVQLQVSAIDLAADVMGFDIASLEVRDCFVTRATLDDIIPASTPERAVDTAVSAPGSLGTTDDGMIDGPDSIKRRWRRITGLPFGARNAAVSALLYDKTYEVRYHSPTKRWFHDLWRTLTHPDGTPVWDDSSSVWRVEIRFKRDALSEADVNDVYDIVNRLPAMWAYAIGHACGGDDGLPDGWLRYVVPSPDLNRSRWPVHPDWSSIQAAFSQNVERERALVPSASLPVEPAPAPVAVPLFPEMQAAPLADTSETADAVGESSKLLSDTPGLPAALVAEPCAPFVRRRKREANMRRGIASAAGWCATIEAWRTPAHDDDDFTPDTAEIEPDLSATLHFLMANIPVYLEETERDFSSLVQKKRAHYRRTAVPAASFAPDLSDLAA